MKNDVLFNIKELYHLIGKTMFNDTKSIPKYKPSGTQVRFIDYLCNHQDDEVTGHDLELAFNLSKATVSDVLNTMEKHKIITRVISQIDTRSKIIILNDEYRKIHKEIYHEIKMINKEITKNINSADIKIFNDVLNKMKDNLSSFNKERNDVND